ncbi:hypothetical protein O6H91_03G111300 [Diphasiastrum complanatum]|nr:hypothetical protein O6H91_03G111100 [Diphasiastrum complanatum]KAJ7563463.1 hypothetical protein O6H91_03G111200 [Diphasiastrum complanatum]KAJ7563464.1 hypothetical protein O6H91_03G111300 [Diphasiastrum complanatum]
MAAAKLNLRLQYQLASMAAILFLLCLLPHYGIACEETVKYTRTPEQSDVTYSNPLYISADWQEGGLISSGNDQLLHFTGASNDFGDAVQLIPTNSFSFNPHPTVCVNDTVTVAFNSFPELLASRWGLIETQGSTYLHYTTPLDAAEFKIVPQPFQPRIWPPIYTYYLESNGVRLARKTINGLTYVVLGNGDSDIQFSFHPFNGPLLKMSTDA